MTTTNEWWVHEYCLTRLGRSKWPSNPTMAKSKTVGLERASQVLNASKKVLDWCFFRISLSTSQRCLLSSWRGRWADFNYKWACKACLFYRVKNLSRLSHGSEASPTIRLFHRPSAPSVLTPTKGSSYPLNRFSIILPRFDDYSFNYDEYLDMEEYWEESNQVSSCNIIILMYFLLI